MVLKMDNPNSRLTYQPFSSILEPGFWQELASVKLNKLGLSKDPIDIVGTYSFALSSKLPCLASLDYRSFKYEPWLGHKTACPMYGKLICMNILQEMIDFDKKKFLESIGQEIWDSICNGTALRQPEEDLSRFGLILFADLKKYKFTFWFAFPALNYPKNVFYTDSFGTTGQYQMPITQVFSKNAMSMFQMQFDMPHYARRFNQGYFVVLYDKLNDNIKCESLFDYKSSKRTEGTGTETYFAFCDPCANEQHPGWPLRNFLALIAIQFQMTEINLIRVRRGRANEEFTSDFHPSMVSKIKLELSEDYKNIPGNPSESKSVQRPIITGWEKNESQQTAPKRVNLSSLLDPIKLADDAASLNLKLMKWRLLPGLALDRISNCRCLLLGCGTLGCHIARGLIAWGIKNIGLVDNSRISYSNPVRQTLYDFSDCFAMNQVGEPLRGLFKAEAAAASLKRIHPTVNVEAHVLSIPMPGHHVTQNEIEQTKEDIEKLEKLIDDYDAIFLLMDTRESRWLPTVIAMSRQKLVINAAIGFDTFLLQRFGIRNYGPASGGEQRSETDEKESMRNSWLASDRLGCYFCNDIVAPGDSTLDRTLDQQCTVSRPGVSMMVSALAVEFLASIVSSREGSLTPAPLKFHIDPASGSASSHDYEEEQFCSELGVVPHSIRGNLSRYHMYMPTSPCFNKCSACSAPVIDNYRQHGFKFLYRVFNEPSYLEEVAGLKDLKNVSDEVWALDSDETWTDDGQAQPIDDTQ